jgi:anti-anti-sigma regulatory factor
MSQSLRLCDYTMRTIQELHQQLLQQLSGSGAVVLDRTEVQRPNTAMLQLLTAFARELRAQSRPLEWSGEPGPLDRAAKALGPSSSLGLPAEG